MTPFYNKDKYGYNEREIGLIIFFVKSIAGAASRGCYGLGVTGVTTVTLTVKDVKK